MVRRIIAASVIVFLFVLYVLISYIMWNNEINDSPVINVSTYEQQNTIINELQGHMFIPDNAEVVSIQLFSDTRDPSVLIVLKTEDYDFSDIEFHSTDGYWSQDEMENTLTPTPAYPFIMINNERIWPIKATNTDPLTLDRIYLYPGTDNKTRVCISISKNTGIYYDIVKSAIADNKAFYFFWK